MPLEISYGAHVAMCLNPSDRRLRPLISPCAPEARIDPFDVHFEIVDEGNVGSCVTLNQMTATVGCLEAEPCDGAFYGAAARDCTGSGPNAGGGTRRFEAAS